MSRRGRSHTRLSHAASISWTQARVVFLAHWRVFAAVGAVFALLSVIFALCEPPRLRATAVLKLKVFDIGKAVNNDPLKGSDSSSQKELLDSQAKLIRLKDFEEELAKVAPAELRGEQLALAWGMGERFRVNLLLRRMGVSSREPASVDVTTLTSGELLALLSRITEVIPNYEDGTLAVQVDALNEETARKVALTMAQAYIATSRKLELQEIQSSITFLRSQRDLLRKRLVEAEDSMRRFFQDNPILANETVKKAALEDTARLQGEFTAKTDELDASRRLLEFYKKKFSGFMKSSDTTTEVYDKFKQELVELKYKRKKYIFQGYAETHEGIIELDEKIKNAERVLASAGDITGKNVVSVDHEAKLSAKIVELQDLIKKQEIDLEALKVRKANAEKRSTIDPDQELLLDDFQRDVRLSREMFDEISRRLETATMRLAASEGYLTLLLSPNFATLVRSLPTGKRVVFSFLVGFVLAVAAGLSLAVARRLVIDELNVNDMGLKYAGDLRTTNSTRAKVLLNLGCTYRGEGVGKAEIVLCSSPSGTAGVAQVLMLTDYLGKQKEKSLFIIVGDMDISGHFQMRSDLGYAKVFTSADGTQFILQISDEDTIYSIRECLAITESQYRLKYSMVFLYIQSGAECLAYPFGQQLADKMLLIGPSAKHSSAEYFKLVEGFKNIDEVYVALTETQRKAPGFLGRHLPGARP